MSNRIGKYILRKRAKSVVRDKQVQNFKSAKLVVIIFDAMIPDCIQPVKDMVKFLREKDIKSHVIGYVPHKEIPDEMLLWKNFHYITKKDMTWYGTPKGEVTEAFLGMEPEILLVISLNEQFVIEYLVKLSKAKFKVGYYTENENDYDLMINTGKDQRTEYYLEQVRNYINMLNS